MRAGLMFLGHPRLNVFRNFDLLEPVIAAWMRRNRPLPLKDAHLLKGGGHRQTAGDTGRRARIVIEVKTHIRCLAGRDGLDLFGRKGNARQSQKAFPFLSKGFTHRD